ncbi:MAG: hypothetical protein ABSH29_24805 [Acidimicrobiales bacterium]|jgi:hypothetical protein
MGDDWSLVDEWEVQWPPGASTAPYKVRLRTELVGDRYEVVRVEIDGTDPDGSSAIRSTDLRLPLRDLLNRRLAEIRSGVAQGVSGPLADLWESAPMAKSRRALENGQPRRPGRPPVYDRAHFEGVAKTYATALRDGRPPTLTVAQEHGVSKATAGKWIARCRQPDLDLLPQTERGTARAPEHRED